MGYGMEITGIGGGHAALALAVTAGVAYTGLGLRQVLGWRGNRPPGPAPSWRWREAAPELPPLSVLKPLCGAEPRLYECLRSFCQQDYPDLQIVFGVRHADDPAVAVVERLRHEFPEREIALVCDNRLHGSNLKISNLVNMQAACRHDLIMLSDSDIEVAPGALRAITAEMTANPAVGAVSCLYVGQPTAGWVSRLGALNVNGWILPSVLLDKAINGIDCAMGAVLLLRRAALDSVGGLKAVADHFADDHEIGERLTEAGWLVRLSAHPVTTMVNETRLSDLLRHEIRWAQTVWVTRPFAHLLSVVCFLLPVQLALLALAPSWPGALAVLGYILLRLGLVASVNRRFALPRPDSLWLVPLRECLCFVGWLGCMTRRTIVWRGHAFRLRRDGRLVPA